MSVVGCGKSFRTLLLFSHTTHKHCAGIATDLLVYSIPIPFIPFQLQKLHYENVSSLVGWLLFAYVRALRFLSAFYAKRKSTVRRFSTMFVHNP